MSNRLPAGPYRNVRLEDGTESPFYVIPFDKRGDCIGPQTRQHLIDAVKEGQFSDLFLFSHGWNNDWSQATKRYEDFLTGYMNMRQTYNLAMPESYRPLLVGIFWPSTVLVFTESEKGPAMAANDPEVMDELVSEELDELTALAEELTSKQTERLYALAQKESLSEKESLELAEILKPHFKKMDDEVGINNPISAQELVEIWATIFSDRDDLDDFGTVDDILSSGPQTAGRIGNFLKKLDPRQIIRATTVWQMKDRAGTVGFHGVGPLLTDLLREGNARVHLIGHSYGGKIVLSAASFGDALPRKVQSILLLQPAVSHLSFADVIPTSGKPGGYKPVLDRVNNPILSTFSKYDLPLTWFFHRALCRKADLGDAKIAAHGEPPNQYAALGGFGPRGSREKIVDIHDVNVPYDLDPKVRIYGLRGDRTIGGHGKISNESTWWALYNLASRGLNIHG